MLRGDMSKELNNVQRNQLKYMLKRKFLIGVDPALDEAINQVLDNKVEFGKVITIQLTMKQVISDEVEDGVIKLEKVN